LRPDDRLRIQHILDHGREALEIVNGKRREDLYSDRLLSLALVRLLEVIGEAAGRVSEETRTVYKDIPWTQIVGLRNRLIHGYDSVDFDILWEILTVDLPGLVKATEKILDENVP
jgi:uncharacterized protein with HEPN domain